MTRDNVDDIVASVEDAVRRAYALGRADAMKRVVELAHSDDPGLRAMALLGPAEPARPALPPALLDAPQPSPAQPLPEHQPRPEHQPLEAHEQAADAADDRHEAREDAAAAEPSPAPQPAMAGQPEREPPASVGEFLADFFYPIGSKKR